MAAHLLKRERRREKAERGGGAGRRRDQNLRETEDPGDACGVRGPRSTESHHGVSAGVLALFDDVDPGCRGHALGDDAVDTPSGLDSGEPELPADPVEGGLGRVTIE